MAAPENDRKRVLVAIDAGAGPLLIELELPVDATIADALCRARETLAAEGGIDWEGGATGVWGERRERSFQPREGDRIELYRSLSADPRAQRRARERRKQSRT